MKNLYLLLVLFFISHCISAQTKVIDISVNWSTATLVVYATDSLCTSVSIQIGTTFQSHDIFNQTSLTVGTDLPHSDVFVIPLSNVTPGVYYVDVKVTSPTGIQEMEFQTSN